jgi:hypothetical protein
MGIFGKLDAATIPTNPFFIAKGNYGAEVVAAKFQTDRDGDKQLYIQVAITDEDSAFFKKKAHKIYDIVDENLTSEELALMPIEEQQKIRSQISTLKRDLCGNDGNGSQKGLGVDVDDLNDGEWNPEVLVGTKINMGIKNWGADNQGVNIQWMNIISEM